MHQLANKRLQDISILLPQNLRVLTGNMMTSPATITPPSTLLRSRYSPVLLTLVLLASLISGRADAGGGPMEVMVLFNASDAEAEAVASYYLQGRQIPSEHGCGVTALETDLSVISFETYMGTIRPAIDGCLEALPYPEEINYIVIVRGLPYRVDMPDAGYSTSLSAMIQVHHAATIDDNEIAGSSQAQADVFYASVLNPIYQEGTATAGDYQVENPSSQWYESAPQVVNAAEQPDSFSRGQLRQHDGINWKHNLFIVSRLDGFDYNDAYDLVDRALEAEAQPPSGELLCMAGADDARGARDPECEFVTRHLSSAGLPGVWLDSHDAALSGRQLSAYFTGAADLRTAIDGNTFVPGAMVDNLTSYGAVPNNFLCDAATGDCPAMETQTSVARFVRAGATVVHGAVAEPLNNCFPNASALLFYTFGYSAGESWIFSQRYLYWQNLYLGDPLVSPFAERPQVNIEWASDEGQPLDEEVNIMASHQTGISLLRLFHNGVLVKETEGSEMKWQPQGEDGDTIQLLAIAIAEDDAVDRPGWPAPIQSPHTAVQGWASEATVLIALTEEDGGAIEPEDPEEPGCSCTASTGATAPPGIWLWLAVLAITWRRLMNRPTRKAHTP
jgi:MYXO-CTERM domain-containing protein